MSPDHTTLTVEERYECLLRDLLQHSLDAAVREADSFEELSQMVTSLIFQAAVGLTLGSPETAKRMVLHYSGEEEGVEDAMSIAEDMLRNHAL